MQLDRAIFFVGYVAKDFYFNEPSIHTIEQNIKSINNNFTYIPKHISQNTETEQKGMITTIIKKN